MKRYLIINLLFIYQISAMGLDWVNDVNDYAHEEKEILYNPTLTVQDLTKKWAESLPSIHSWLQKKERWTQGVLAYCHQKGDTHRIQRVRKELDCIAEKCCLVEQAIDQKK